jgi:5'-3' exonuclease
MAESCRARKCCWTRKPRGVKCTRRKPKRVSSLVAQCNDDNIEEQGKLEKYSKHIDNEIKYVFLDYLTFRKANFIVAPYEADAQLAFMFNKGIIDIVVTEDSDLIAYNCTKILKSLKPDGVCCYLDLTKKVKKQDDELVKAFLDLGWLIRERQSDHCLCARGLRLLAEHEGNGHVHYPPVLFRT